MGLELGLLCVLALHDGTGGVGSEWAAGGALVTEVFLERSRPMSLGTLQILSAGRQYDDGGRHLQSGWVDLALGLCRRGATGPARFLDPTLCKGTRKVEPC